ncbi:MAG: sodium/glutamate symporter [Eubacterium sp.]
MNVITVYGNKMNIQLDMYQTLAIAVVVLILGQFLKSKIYFLEKFCIPAPVVGGLLFAILTCICYATGLAEFSFDDTLREVCMVFFFTSVGFQANLKVLKSGGKVTDCISWHLLLYLIISPERLLAVGAMPKLLGLDPLNWYVYRFYTNGWWSWYCRCLWTGS